MVYNTYIKNQKGQNMAIHFLLSSKAKDLSIIEVARMSEDEAIEVFKSLRWSDTNGEPVCPKCGCTEHWYLPSTKRYKCKGCKKQYSVTSGTIFADHKLPLRDYLVVILLFANDVKGASMLKLSRDLKVNYKTAFLLTHKIRASLLDTRDESQMDGICEMDALHTNMYVKPANKEEKRIDQRKMYKPNKRAVIVTRQRDISGLGAKRTITDISIGETATAMAFTAFKNIKEGSIVHTDEATAFEPLHVRYDRKIVNHSKEYCSIDGNNNNQCESFNARFRRMQIGIHHHVSSLYLSNYANEIAFREDSRRMTNGEIMKDILTRCLMTPEHGEWRGYHQGNKRVAERLIA